MAGVPPGENRSRVEGATGTLVHMSSYVIAQESAVADAMTAAPALATAAALAARLDGARS